MRYLRHSLPRLPALALTGWLMLSACSDSTGPSPDLILPPPPPKPVLVLGDQRTEDSVAAILTRAGIEVRLGGNYWEYAGGDLNEVSAVLLLTGYEWDQTMPMAAQDELAAFVAAGGGLMTIEWLTYNRFYDTGYQDRIGDIVPARYAGDYAYTEETYTSRAAGHPILAGLPASFTVTGSWSYSVTLADTTESKSALVILEGSASGDAVVAGRHGEGRTVHWNMAGEYRGAEIWSTEVRRLLGNIVEYVSRRS